MVESIFFIGLDKACFWPLLITVNFLIHHQLRQQLASINLADVSLALVIIVLVIFKLHILCGALNVRFLILQYHSKYVSTSHRLSC